MCPPILRDAEANYTFLYVSGTLTIASGTGADLIESGVSVAGMPISGGSISVTDTTSNSGGGAAFGSYTYVYLSANGTTKGTTLNNRYVGSLAAGASSSGSTAMSLPTNLTGTYYVMACANGNGNVVESNTNNNCTASASFIIPH